MSPTEGGAGPRGHPLEFFFFIVISRIVGSFSIIGGYLTRDPTLKYNPDLGLNFSDRDPVFYIFNIGILFLNSQLLLVFKCNICRYILVDCKIDGKHLCLSRRASAAFRLLNISVYKPNGS